MHTKHLEECMKNEIYFRRHDKSFKIHWCIFKNPYKPIVTYTLRQDNLSQDQLNQV